MFKIMEDSAKKSDLFGFGMVMYGFADLLVRHPKDFLVLLGHIWSDYIFEEYKSAHSVKYVDIELDNRILARPGALNSYLGFIPFLIGSLGFLKWKFGNKAGQDICFFMKEVKNIFSDAGFVFENAPTRLQYRQSPGMGLKILHFFDRPKNCFPSLHVMLASYSYLKTKELISKHSPNPGLYFRADSFLLNWSLKIIESCLLTKQHSLRDIAGGLALISAKYPQFDQKDVKEIIDLLFLNHLSSFPEDIIYLAKEEIRSVYAKLVLNIDNKNGDYRLALVNYVRSI